MPARWRGVQSSCSHAFRDVFYVDLNFSASPISRVTTYRWRQPQCATVWITIYWILWPTVEDDYNVPVRWSGSNHSFDAAMDLNYFLPKMIQAMNHHLVLCKTRNSSEYLELLKSEMCSMNVGEGVFVSGVYVYCSYCISVWCCYGSLTSTIFYRWCCRLWIVTLYTTRVIIPLNLYLLKSEMCSIWTLDKAFSWVDCT